MSKFFAPLNINPWSINSLGSKILMSGDDSISDAASNAYPSANLAIFIPFFLQQPMVVDRLFWGNGSTLGGNVDVGIYDAGKRLIVSTTATAQSGASDVQSVNITNVALGTGLFFMAISVNSATATIMSLNTLSVPLSKAAGIFHMASAHPLPTLATFSYPTLSCIPVYGLTPRSTL